MPGTDRLRTAIDRNLRRFERVEAAARGTPAAVAILLLEGDDGPTIPMFQRPTSMSRHAGQMALPGGKVDPGETVEECAIREAGEELGLIVGEDGVLGRLDDFNTRSGFTITPVVIWTSEPATKLRPSPHEVKRLFLVDCDELRQTVAAATTGADHDFSLRFPEVEVFAPTAAILYQFSEVALEGRSTRVADFYQPPWTHR